VNNLMDLNETLELLGRLRSSFESYTAAMRDADLESSREFARLERQHTHARQQLEENRTTTIAEAQAAFETAKTNLESRAARRQTRVGRARTSVQNRRLKTLVNREAREVFQVQRELLQTTRTRDAAVQQADAQQAAFIEQWNLAGDALSALQQRAATAFRGYPGLRRRFEDRPAEPARPDLAPDADQQLQFAQSLTQQGGDALTRFRRLILPRLFSLAPCWLIVLLLVAIHAAAVPLFRMIDGPALTWPQAGIAGATFVLITLALYLWSRRHALPAVETLARTIHQARAAHAAAEQTAVARHQHTHAHALHECETRTAALEQAWNAALRTGEQERATVTKSVDAKLNRTLESIEQQRVNGLARLEATFHSRVDQLRIEANSGLEALEAEHTAKQKALSDRRQSRQLQADAELRSVVEPGYARLSAVRQTVEGLSPAWTAPEWRDWAPPSDFIPAAPFGQITLDLAPITDRPELLSKLPGPSRLEVPLMLSFPNEGSIWFETREHGRDAAVAALNNLVLRLLAGAPPGRIAFTILDPVGLGQNFAGLMHLTDHSDRLINRRIWTQPEQIDQQLADLNEHIEKVTQLYLRNEYQSIAEYNEQAGRVAEPYQFLVIADFPVGFSDLAARRLLSIVSSGPRCGVFTLVHWDRRKPAPTEFAGDDARKSGIWLESTGHGFAFGRPAPPGIEVKLDEPPDAAQATALLQQIGRSSIDAYRVELPFAQIAPGAEDRWSLDTIAEVRVPVGITGATKLLHVALGKGTRQHALIAGKTGSGKSTLFHVLITNLALWAGPDQVEFYLVDFKKGVEFKCYATHRLPHARVVAIESDREFALSVLERLDEELRRRGDLFRQLGVQDLPGYQRADGSHRLPRALLIIDEFQEFFTEDDRVAQNAALLLDRLVRQGRAFGIHVLLGSQTLGGAYTLARSTLGQMTIRIALQCNQADALLIMDDDNAAPRLLSRPGEAIYNDAAGALEGNHPFQVAWLSDDERDNHLRAIRQHADRVAPESPAPVVFEGNAPANVRDNPALTALLASPKFEAQTTPRIWLGAPNSIKGPTEAPLRRQSGNHLLLVGLYEETILALLGVSLVALAAQHRHDAAKFVILDASPRESSQRDFLERLIQGIPQHTALVGPTDLGDAFKNLGEELDRRSGSDPAGPAIFVFVHQVQRFKALRFEDEFSISLEEGGASPAQQLTRILSDGPPLGMHLICSCDTYNNATRFFGRKALSEFELRVLFQMSAGDSASLIDNPKAASLGLHRALLYNAQEGSLETFRPYALPDDDWVRQSGAQLSRLVG
jgi:DNA segregation ATPase FtsK/SpoIIIE, S-DNA-T family